MEEKVREYCNKLGVEYGEILGKEKKHNISTSRHYVWFMLRIVDKYGINDISYFFGVHQMTVIRGVGLFTNRIYTRDKEVLVLFNKLNPLTYLKGDIENIQKFVYQFFLGDKSVETFVTYMRIFSQH